MAPHPDLNALLLARFPPKDKMTDANEFIQGLADPEKRRTAEALDALFRDTTGCAPQLWQGRIIGYGSYDYTYASGRSGTWLATGFAVGAKAITIYILPGYTDFPDITPRIGKHKQGKSCIYFNKLSDINIDPLKEFIRAGLEDLDMQFPVKPT